MGARLGLWWVRAAQRLYSFVCPSLAVRTWRGLPLIPFANANKVFMGFRYVDIYNLSDRRLEQAPMTSERLHISTLINGLGTPSPRMRPLTWRRFSMSAPLLS